MKNRKYTKEMLQPLVKKVESYRQLILSLNLSYCGGNYSHIKNVVESFDIDTSHFKGQSIHKGKPSGRARTKEEFTNDILIEDSKVNWRSSSIKQSLLKFGFKEDICEVCGQDNTWNGKPITLQLDHIDGNNRNNNLDNLRIICPNCHTQTETYAGKKTKKNTPR